MPVCRSISFGLGAVTSTGVPAPPDTHTRSILYAVSLLPEPAPQGPSPPAANPADHDFSGRTCPTFLSRVCSLPCGSCICLPLPPPVYPLPPSPSILQCLSSKTRQPRLDVFARWSTQLKDKGGTEERRHHESADGSSKLCAVLTRGWEDQTTRGWEEPWLGADSRSCSTQALLMGGFHQGARSCARGVAVELFQKIQLGARKVKR